MAISAEVKTFERIKKSVSKVSDVHLAGRYDELEVLYRITDTISTNLDLDDIFRHIIQLVHELTRADACLLYLLMDGYLTLRSSLQPHPELIGNLKIKVVEGVTGWVADHRQPVVIPKEAYNDPRFLAFHDLPEDRYHSFFSLPLFFRDTVIGVLNIHHHDPFEYPEHIKHLLLVVARQVGGAIENARLLEETQTLKSVLETRKTIDLAKGLLAERLHVNPDQAYETLVRQSRKLGKSVKEMAEAMILTDEMQR